MSYRAIVYNVMITCPSDIKDEKDIVKKNLEKYNLLNSNEKKIVLLPKMWDSHSYPLAGTRPQSIINKTVLQDSDILIAIFWTRLGTPTGKAESGSLEEIHEHLTLEKPALIYFSNKEATPGYDQDQYSKLMQFKKSIRERALYHEYSDLKTFEDSFYRNISHLIQTHEYFNEIKNETQPEANSKQGNNLEGFSYVAQYLLKMAANSQAGRIGYIHVLGGPIIQVGGDGYNISNPREKAIYKEAMDDLEINGLIEATGNKREVFNVTAKGFRVAEKIDLEELYELDENGILP